MNFHSLIHRLITRMNVRLAHALTRFSTVASVNKVILIGRAAMKVSIPKQGDGRLRTIVIERGDPLKHFSRDKPGVKLAALLIIRASGVAAIVLTIGATRGWW